MKIDQLLEVLSRVHGCTFASLDARTEPSPGIYIHVERLSVLLYASQQSGYEKMVKRRLLKYGKDPDSFSVGPLPWGSRLDNFPIIINRRKHYLQTIPLSPGIVRGFIANIEVPINSLIPVIGREKSNPNQGLPEGKQVKVRTYALDSIQSIRLMGEEIQ